jgi:hypothetical protein
VPTVRVLESESESESDEGRNDKNERRRRGGGERGEQVSRGRGGFPREAEITMGQSRRFTFGNVTLPTNHSATCLEESDQSRRLNVGNIPPPAYHSATWLAESNEDRKAEEEKESCEEEVREMRLRVSCMIDQFLCNEPRALFV